MGSDTTMADLLMGGTLTNRLLSGLVESAVLSQQTVDEALERARETKRNVAEVLVEEGFISKDALAAAVERMLDLPRVDLTSYVPDPEALKLIPKSIVHRFLILPLFEIEGVLTVAIPSPVTAFYLDAISDEVGLELDPVLSSEDSIVDAVIIYYGISPDEITVQSVSSGSSGTQLDAEEVREEDLFRIDLDRLAILEGSAVADLVGELLLKAKKAKASAIHIEPIEGDFRVLFRLGGQLRMVGMAARSLQKPLTEYLKGLARFPRQIEQPVEKILDLPRVGESILSMYPTVHGERIVINLGAGSRAAVESFDQLGMDEKDRAELTEILAQERGLIVIGAPVNSGKTTTLRSLLREASHDGQKSAFLLAAEEVKPVEKVQFQKLRGEELLSAIEGLIHQDVDVVGIDEVDTPEALRAAVRLAERSLVILSLEASNAADAIARILENGIEVFSLSWALSAVISQRVLARNCDACSEEYRSPLSTHKVVKALVGENRLFKRSRGCDACDATGTKGFVAVFEVVVLTEAMKRRIATGYNPVDFQNQLRSKGVPSLLQSAMKKATEGLVTLEEVYRATGFRD